VSGRVKREDFFGNYAYPELARATAYQFAWSIGRRGRLDRVGRNVLRSVMRDAALRAVRHARNDAEKRAKEAA
jgi:hypothetical protein